MSNREIKISKFLSLVLRHQPEKIGLILDAAGWVSVSELMTACQTHGLNFTFDELLEIVANNDKKRFAFNEDQTKIRANQGHSIEVKLGYSASVPPAILYHGTATRNIDSILTQGLLKGQRHHVHLSADIETAIKVGMRYGKPVVFEVQADAMHANNIQFFCSENGVWLTAHVPTSFLKLKED